MTSRPLPGATRTSPRAIRMRSPNVRSPCSRRPMRASAPCDYWAPGCTIWRNRGRPRPPGRPTIRNWGSYRRSRHTLRSLDVHERGEVMEFKSRAVRSLVELHEQEMRSFLQVWKRFMEANAPMPEAHGDESY